MNSLNVFTETMVRLAEQDRLAGVQAQPRLARRHASGSGRTARAPITSLSTASYEPTAQGSWELRNNLSSYDAWCVALPEALDMPLVTLRP